jgi:predicted house-cleaning noncanonical NTP pyrophosphatase (MazG superfamily)
MKIMFLLTDFINRKLKKHTYLRYEKQRTKSRSTDFKEFMKTWNIKHIIVKVNEKVVFDSHSKEEMKPHLAKTIKTYLGDIIQNNNPPITEASFIYIDEKKLSVLKDFFELKDPSERLSKIINSKELRELLGIKLKNKVMELSFSSEMKGLSA